MWKKEVVTLSAFISPQGSANDTKRGVLCGFAY